MSACGTSIVNGFISRSPFLCVSPLLECRVQGRVFITLVFEGGLAVLLTVPAVERQVPMRVVGVAKESRAAKAGAVAEELTPCATGPICEPELGSELLLDLILP